MRETGTICEIGVSTAERSFFWADFALQKQRCYEIQRCLGDIHWKRSAKSPRMTLFGPKNAPFPCKNANLKNGTYFTRPRVYAWGAAKNTFFGGDFWPTNITHVIDASSRERKFSPKFFWLGSWTSAASGHGCPRRNACFSSSLRTLTKVLGRDIRANDPQMSAGYPS